MNFVSEFLVLLGTWQTYRLAAILAAAGLLIAMAYSLRIFQAAFHGEQHETWIIQDLSARETGVLFVMIAFLVGLGVYPQPVLAIFEKTLSGVLAVVGGGT